MGILDRITGTLDGLAGGDGDGSRESEAARALAEAAAHAANGAHEEAAAAFGRIVDRAPTSGEAWLGLARALARLDRFEPARDAFRRALTLPLGAEAKARAQADFGGLYARAGQLGKAVRELRKAAEALPDDAQTAAAMGRALVAAGEPEGVEWLARAARLPNGTAASLVEAAAASPDPAAAVRLLREAAAAAPDDADVRAALARRLASAGELDAALAEALAGADANPTRAVACASWRTTVGSCSSGGGTWPPS